MDVTASSHPETAWSTAGGTNSRRGIFRGRVDIAPKPARVLAASAGVQASVVFDSADRAFVADMAGGVQAFKPGGRLLWQRRLEGGIPATPVLSSDGRTLFAGTDAGWVYAMDASSGSVEWRTGIPTQSDARILSDLLFLTKRRCVVLSSWGGRFVALDGATGKEQQSWDAGVSPFAAAAADTDENVYCMRAVRKAGVQLVRVGADGNEIVLQQEDESEGPANRALVSAAPVLDPERRMLYFAANSGRSGALKAWSLEQERVMWTRRLEAAIGATPAVSQDGRVTLADMGGVVHVLAADGSVAYRYVSGSDYLLGGAVCDERGKLFLADPLGVVHVITESGVGGPVFELPRAAQTRPSFDSGGNLYVPGTDRRVYVFANTSGRK